MSLLYERQLLVPLLLFFVYTKMKPWFTPMVVIVAPKIILNIKDIRGRKTFIILIIDSLSETKWVKLRMTEQRVIKT